MYKCEHCLLEIDEKKAIKEEIDGKMRIFCCPGCMGIFHILHDAGLEKFYKTRVGWQPGPPQEVDINLDIFLENINEIEGLREIEILIFGIRCASCIWLIEHFMKKFDGIVDVRVNYATYRTKIRWDPQKISLLNILDNIKSIGYIPKPYVSSVFEESLSREKRDLLIRFGSAAFFSMQLMLYTIALYAGYFQGIENRYRLIFQLITWGLATPVIFYSGYPFIKNSLGSLKNRVFNMDILIFLGSFSAYLYSIFMIFIGGEVYFDTSSMIITFILLGRFIEIGARSKAGEAISLLMNLQSKEARKVEGLEMGIKLVPVSSLKSGDIIEVTPGERIPLDCIIIDGYSEVDESMLTGESIPVRKQKGDEVFSGTINLNGRLRLKVIRVGKETFISQIIKAVEDAQARKSKIQVRADRVMGWFIPAILLISIFTFLYWFYITSKISYALMNAVSVLVVSCPCAIGLATPLAIFVGSTIASKRGILIKGGDILEAVSEINYVVFDKTGTLTKGEPVLIDIVTEEDGEDELIILKYAASLESCSEHSLKKAVISAYKGELFQLKDFRVISGRGIEGIIEEEKIIIGNKDFMEEKEITLKEKLKVKYDKLSSEGKTVIFVGIEGKVVGLLVIVDEIKDRVREMVKELRRKNINIKMVTGDNFYAAKYISIKSGIDDFISDATPLKKAEIIREIKSDGYKVIMVGDGINDAPSLIEAHIGITFGKATDISLKSANVVIMRDNLRLIIDLFNISKNTLSIIKENICWALSYNFIVIPFAVSGFLHPIISAISMTISSIVVLCNSLRLRNKEWV